ncbi:conserved hypothetical protein [Rippkaea orientalis PCC 8801]|uniref:Uncharacterized protein n=1 Tax=Rippkaea orientalis (strain PCC 8801 / RF-1) TaxID=41431 RepID=B7JZD3_RIPO1|nr:DUF6761 family protein [Rippkaea orientalis]ACK67344.1 conserved hypothetical protein [Rippkaea orientalis PCC 8801]
MLQDAQAIRYYQKLTDGMVDLWHRGRRFDEIQCYMDGYLACLRHSNTLEAYVIHRLEEESWRFFRDPSNFELAQPQLQTEVDYY